MTDEELIYSGFIANEFKVFSQNRTNNCQPLRLKYKVNCGGMHRSWDLMEDDQTGSFSFLHIQKGQFTVNKLDLLNDKLLTKNLSLVHGIGSGVHINDVCFIVKKRNSKDARLNDREIFLAYGGEDTSMRVAKLENADDKLSFKVQTNFSNHISSIFSINCFNSNQIISTGGRNQLHTFDLMTEKYNQFTIKLDEDNKILECIEFVRFPDPKNSDAKETLYFCLISDGQMIIYNSDTDQIESKIMSGKLVISCQSWKGKILIGNTEGELALIDCQFIDRENFEIPWQKLHDSGVTTIASDYLFDFVYTAGEDGNIVISKINQKKQIFEKTQVISGLHNAQIADLKLMKIEESDSKYFLFSCGLDQRLSISEIDTKTGDGKIFINCIETYCSSVADLTRLDVCKIEGEKNSFLIVLAGHGIEILNFRS